MLPDGWSASARMPAAALPPGILVTCTPVDGTDWDAAALCAAAAPGRIVNLCAKRYYAPTPGTPPVTFLRVHGGGAVPRERDVRFFIRVLNRHFAQGGGQQPIVVHCTHGQNRSGYFIVRYLMQRMRAAEAVALFAAARPPGIQRPELLRALLG